MATLPPTRGRPRRSMGHEGQKSRENSASASTLPSWCSGFRKESLDSERAYDERVTTSTKTSEIRLRQESVRYWNRFLEEAEVAAFARIVRPTCHQIQNILLGDFGGHSWGSGENEDQEEEKFDRRVREMNDDSMEIEGEKKKSKDDSTDNTRTNSGNDGDWEYCQRMFGLPSVSKTDAALLTTVTNGAEKTEMSSQKSKSLPLSSPSDQHFARIRYPFEVLPVFVITSPLVSNCVQDRSKICHSIWRQLNGLECTIGTQLPAVSFGDGGNQSVSHNSNSNERNICLYLPRLLSSLTETLQVLWDGLLSHYENTHDAPSMDPDDPHYYSNPNDLSSKRHSYHVSKRRHYQDLVDRKVTTESQKSKIGTKKQQSLQDFILEFLRYVYEEPEDFAKQERHNRKRENTATANTQMGDGNGDAKRKRPMRGNLIVLLKDPRILHPKVSTAAGQGSVGGSNSKPTNNKVVQSQLLETLAAWREIHGIPVSLVVLNSVGSKHEIQQNNVLLNPSFESSAIGGRFGVQTIRCSIPSSASSRGANIPTSMAFGVWSHYFLQATATNPLPLMCPGQQINSFTVTEIILRMCRDALQNESSCSKLVSLIRARLVLHFYASKGSFVWDALNPNTAAMMRGTPLLSAKKSKSEMDITTDSNTNSDNGINKDRKPFVVGNDDVQIFQPEFVAWFCSYHKAHTLLSCQAGEHKANTTLSDKCDALLKCHRLLLPPMENNDENNLEEKSSKRRKYSNGAERVRDTKGGGNLQFWWSVSCSLLPLYFLYLTVTDEGMLLSSIASSVDRSAANENSKRRNKRPLDGESRWILERLAEVYKQLLAVTEERDHCNKNLDAVNHMGDEVAGKTRISGTSTTPDGCSIDSVPKEFIGKSSEHNIESCHERGDFVEVILRRYLQRETKEGGSDTRKKCNSLSTSDGATTIDEVHRQSVRQLTTMLQETIVLVAAFAMNEKKSSSLNVKKEDDLMGDDKIRLGMTETILEMNRLALGQVEAWTRQWVKFNPLMAATSEQILREDWKGDHIDDLLCDDVNQLHSFETRPMNFRRRILDNLPAGSRELYEALEGRLSIDRDDWFHSFDGPVEDFIIGIWTLRKCGLIHPKKTIAATDTPNYDRGKAKKPRKVVSYEKIAVVWC